MIAFIDDHRDVHGVEPICEVLPIAPSTYRAHAATRRDPEKSSARAKRDAGLREKIRRVHDENFQVYGARKIWRQLLREGESVARCTVERLMRDMGLQGAVRGKPVKTTVSDKAAPCPQDKVNRQFQAPRPNALWVSDFTYVATWAGFVYVAFVIDTFARRIVGWRASRTAHAGFVLDALEQALCERRPVRGGARASQRPRRARRIQLIVATLQTYLILDVSTLQLVFSNSTPFVASCSKLEQRLPGRPRCARSDLFLLENTDAEGHSCFRSCRVAMGFADRRSTCLTLYRSAGLHAEPSRRPGPRSASGAIVQAAG